MYIECKAESLNGPARIGRVIYSKSGTSVYYQGRRFRKLQGYKSNFIEADVSDEFWISGRGDCPKEYWISGPRHDGDDRLYKSNLPVEIDDDVREEYWTQIRKRPDLIARKHT